MASDNLTPEERRTLAAGLAGLLAAGFVIVLGVAMIYLPAGVIAAGLLIAAFALLLIRGSGQP